MNAQCQHGNHWETCKECELALALETERRHGQDVDAARKTIEEAQAKGWEVSDAR